jgi:probable HAF family extracellular repeat protein
MAWAQKPDIASMKDSFSRHRMQAMAKQAPGSNSYRAAHPLGASKLSYYEASLQFSDSSNPSGTWSYGYTKKVGGAFTPYTISGVVGTFDGWYGYTLGGNPLLVTDSNLTGTYLLTSHPGPNNEQSVARWTAPSTGTFDFLGFFYGLDLNYGSDVYVLKNKSVMYHDSVSGYEDEKDYSLVFSLRKGDKIDFVVATTPGNPAGGAYAGIGVVITPQLFNFVTVQYPGVPNTMVWGINNLGDIVGRYRGSDNVRHGFMRRKGVFTTIDYPNLGTYATGTYATGINDWGQVVGYAFGFDQDGNITVLRAYLWDKGNFTDLVPSGAVDSTAFGINDFGYISGQYDYGDTSLSYGFVCDTKANCFTYQVPGSVDGTTYADGLNLWGQVAGEYEDQDGAYHGYVRNPNGNFSFLDFPGLYFPASGLDSINLWETSVGVYYGLGGPAIEQSFLNVGSDFYPLWAPVTPYNGEYTQANTINDWGQVVGYYVGYDNIFHGFIATPVVHFGH